MQLSDRKALGAYYTPAELARYLATAAIDRPMDVLEPAAGNGSLIEAIATRQKEVGGGAILGFEIDTPTFDSLDPPSPFKIQIRNADFFKHAGELHDSFDAVIANPPFTRNHALSRADKLQLRAAYLSPDSSGGAPGLWVYFILASLKCLRTGGNLGFVLPGAAVFADYFKPVCSRLLESFSTVELLEVTERVRWEGSAQERAVLLIARGYRNGRASGISHRRLDLGAQALIAEKVPAYAPVLPHTLLGSIAHIEIGFVTGANRFFLLSQHDVESAAISDRDIVPAAARHRHVLGTHLSKADLYGLSNDGERTLLLRPNDLGGRGSPVRSHLSSIPRAKRKSTAWFKKRKPWWLVQVGAPADAVFTYMNHLGPRICLLEEGIAVSNTLHKVIFKNREMDAMRAACVSILTTYSQLHAEILGRIYGGGVLKFELKDARAIPLLIPGEGVPAATFNRINTALRSGAEVRARHLADEAIMPLVCGPAWHTLRDKMEQDLMRRREARGAR